MELETCRQDGLSAVLSALHMKHCLISIGLDNSICLIDAEELFWYFYSNFCKFRFLGHDATIKNIIWKCNDEIMAVECASGTVHVWQFKTGHLDRVENGPVVEDILCDFDWGISVCGTDQSSQKTLSIHGGKSG